MNYLTNILNNDIAHRIYLYIYKRTTRKIVTYYGVKVIGYGGVSSKEIAKALGIPLRTVQYYLRKLVRLGYISRWEVRFSRTKRVVRYGIKDKAMFNFVCVCSRESLHQQETGKK